ncbi:MAG: serine hydrolase domain-containing protein [Maricaulaceae bacterium]|jgi:CubicO group peptidase (beta-lactamase class C family)
MTTRPALFPAAALALVALITSSALGQPVDAPVTDAPASTATLGGQPLDERELEALIDDLVEAQMAAHQIPGAVIAITHGSEIVLLKGYGVADLETRAPVDPEGHLFRIASVSKPFAWTSVMQLADRGVVDLDADVNAYLDFEIPDTYPGQPITLRHLMTHTSGFEAVNVGGGAWTEQARRPLGDALKALQPQRIRPPGSASAYSNYGAALTGYIVERMSGQPYPTYLEDNIFGPLGMERSTIRQPPPDDLIADLAPGHTIDEGEPIERPFEFMNLYPDGGVSATARDMALFAIAHMTNGGPDHALLSERAYNAMHAPQFANIPQGSAMTFGFEQKIWNGHVTFGHGGDIPGYTARLVLIPDDGTSIFISFNSGDVGPARERIVQGFMDRYYPGDDGDFLYSSAPLENATDDVAGAFVPTRRSFSTIEKIVWPLMIGATIERETDDRIHISFAGDTYPFERVSEGVYAPPPEALDDMLSLGAALFTKDPASGARRLYFTQQGSFAFEEPPAQESLTLHLRLLIAAAAMCALGIVTVLVTAVRQSGASHPFAWPIAGASALASVVAFAFAPLAATRLNEDLVYGIPNSLRIVFALPPIGISLCALAIALLAWATIQRKVGSPLLIVGVALGAGGIAIFSWQLSVWNMLGFSGLPG